MKEVVKFGGILLFITGLAAGLLAYVDSLTKPKIEEQKKSEQETALGWVLPQAKEGVIVPCGPEGEALYYIGYARKETTDLVGYAFLAKGTGYSSDIETMVGVDTSGVITGIRILSQEETPGLGSRIIEVRPGEEEPWFQCQFRGKKANQVAVEKDRGEINSITGATISSRAVANSIREGALSLEKLIKEAKEE
jgi:electron transport complex protein RnfG